MHSTISSHPRLYSSNVFEEKELNNINIEMIIKSIGIEKNKLKIQIESVQHCQAKYNSKSTKAEYIQKYIKPTPNNKNRLLF